MKQSVKLGHVTTWSTGQIVLSGLLNICHIKASLLSTDSRDTAFEYDVTTDERISKPYQRELAAFVSGIVYALH